MGISSQIMVRKCRKCNLGSNEKVVKIFFSGNEKLLKKIKINFSAKTIFKFARPVV